MNNKPLYSGKLIVIEGIDGSGKSTLAKALHEKLLQNNYPSYLTKEPGDTQLGAKIRTIIQDPSLVPTPKAEYLLFAADRAEHIECTVLPLLKGGFIIISDRLSDSSIVYQGYARKVDIEMISTINAWTMQGITPDLTLYTKIDAKTAQKRIQLRNEHITRFEAQPLAFYQDLINGFESLYENNATCITLDATQPPPILCQQAFEAISTSLKKTVGYEYAS